MEVINKIDDEKRVILSLCGLSEQPQIPRAFSTAGHV